jgi:hypothetical protein
VGSGAGKGSSKKQSVGIKKGLLLLNCCVLYLIMAFIFRKRIRLAKGLYLNFSKKGLSSVSASPFRGLTFSTSPRGTRRTISLPGTGMRWTSTSARRRREPQPGPGPSFNPKLAALGLIVALFVAGLNFSGQSPKPEAIAQAAATQKVQASQPAADLYEG